MPRRCTRISNGRSIGQGHDDVGRVPMATRKARASFFLMTAVMVLVSANAFHTFCPRHAQPARFPLPTRPATVPNTVAEAALDPIIADLRARIAKAPVPLEGNEESRRHAEATLSTRFEIGSDGKLIGGAAQEARLARALALDTFVVVRATCPEVRGSLARLGGAAEHLLGETRTVEEKIEAYGTMRDYEEGVVSGYAGGGDYGKDQFLETRGRGGNEIAPEIGGDTATDVIEGRVSCTAVRGIIQQLLRYYQ